MSQNQNCQKCNQLFEIEDVDLDFYQRISPIFNEKTYPIPAPTLCPSCRLVRRLIWRNEFTLYRRKSDKSGQEMVSIYAPDSKYTVYSLDEWWSDDWDAADYAQEYDSNRTFFDQFGELLDKVPRVTLFNSKTEDCEYVNYTSECKNCYMSAILYHNTENTHFSYWAYTCTDNSDITFAEKAENCYFSFGITNTYNCKYSKSLTNCRDCYYCLNLVGCKNCLFSSNLLSKEYYVRNQPVSKEEYEIELQKLKLGSWQSWQENYPRFLEMKNQSIVKYANLDSLN